MGGEIFLVHFVHVVLSSLIFMCSCTNHVWHVKSDSAIALSSQVAVSQNFAVAILAQVAVSQNFV